MRDRQSRSLFPQLGEDAQLIPRNHHIDNKQKGFAIADSSAVGGPLIAYCRWERNRIDVLRNKVNGHEGNIADRSGQDICRGDYQVQRGVYNCIPRLLRNDAAGRAC